jgi:predicted nucleic acid-binding protein
MDALVRDGVIQLAWSYILDFENMNNPFIDRRESISAWRPYASVDCVETPAIKATAGAFAHAGLPRIDALHVACAADAGCDCFITTDDQILGKAGQISEIKIVDPIEFIKKELP